MALLEHHLGHKADIAEHAVRSGEHRRVMSG